MVPLEDLVAALKELNEKGGKLDYFKLRPPATETDVSAIETRYGFRAPEDYRRFLIEVGNGGTHDPPIFTPFGMRRGMHDFVPWEDDLDLGDPSKPFPHTEAWREGLADERTEEEDYRYMTEASHGTIPLQERGCGMELLLVVTGREAGHVWLDRRVDNAGLSPISLPDMPRLHFSDWLMVWLNRGLKKPDGGASFW
jgi:hypothetical protein